MLPWGGSDQLSSSEGTVTHRRCVVRSYPVCRHISLSSCLVSVSTSTVIHAWNTGSATQASTALHNQLPAVAGLTCLALSVKL